MAFRSLFASKVPNEGAIRSAVWRLLFVAPLLVGLVGVVVALAIGIVGFSELSEASIDQANRRADWISTLLGERLAHIEGSRLDAIQFAARRTGAEILVMTKEGETSLDATLKAPDANALQEILKNRRGEMTTAMGRTRYVARELPSDPHLLVVSFVRIPRAPDGAPALLRALAALTTLLIGVATIVGYAVARDAQMDISYVTRRVEAMSVVRNEPAGERVPVRTMDEVGALTSAFNDLVDRFSAAESSYKNDLVRAKMADRERAEFLSAVSHELRTPLNAVLGFADILISEVDGPLSTDTREEIEQIRQSGAHLSDLVGDILDFSALEGGKLKLERVPTDLAAMGRDLVKESAVLVMDKPVVVRALGEENLIADVDPKRTRQIVGNFLGNAIKFTQSGEVSLSVWQRGQWACITVADTGPGIRLADQATIFDEYGQATAEKGKRRGTGLGLTIARRLTLMHGGRVEFQSKWGVGSTFTIWLPLGKIDRQRESTKP